MHLRKHRPLREMSPLVASIYGMNFHKGMIELEWELGYRFALMLMILAAILPIVYFKWRKWL